MGRQYENTVLDHTSSNPVSADAFEEFVYNSTLPCIAVESMRERLGRPPFGYLHRLQQLFFVEGRNINDARVLADAAVDFGCERESFRRGLQNPALAARVTDAFASSRRYGTNALPSLLWEADGVRALLAGGYADADMLVTLIDAKRSSRSPA